MKKISSHLLAIAVASTTGISSAMAADSVSEALKSSTAFGNFRLRYEDVDKDGTSSDGLTLRSRIGIKTSDYKGFSAVVETEDVRDVFGIDDELGFIPDPEVTEIDQAFIQYKSDSATTTVGRQVIALDGHRFVGHVGFRQDRQTFDAIRTQFSTASDLKIDLSYIFQRNRIFGEDMDAESSDFLINAAYPTAAGKLVGYAYLLDDEVRDEQSSTYGASLVGSTGDSVKVSYAFELATQSIEDSGVDYDTGYMFVEGGLVLSSLTAKLGYEVLGSDDGLASFTTPLATLHKFNGWNDIFLGGTFNPTAMPDGLVDTYVSLSTKLGGVALSAVYHDYSADEGSATYGDEIGFSLGKSYSNGISTGLKYSSYSADTYAVDTDKLWIWAGYSF